MTQSNQIKGDMCTQVFVYLNVFINTFLSTFDYASVRIVRFHSHPNVPGFS